MRNLNKKILLITFALSLSGAVFATGADSVKVYKKYVRPVDKTKSFLLAQGYIQGGDGSGNNTVTINPTRKRCPANMQPSLSYSVRGVQVYMGYAIKGIESHLSFNPQTYQISGYYYSPTAGTINPNYVVFNYQIFCMSA